MTAMADIVKVSWQIQNGAGAWYEKYRVPEAFRRAHPMVLARAAIDCEGDWRRCVIDDDGSITVFNHPVWTPEAS